MRIVYLILGILSLILGFIGAFLPVLPTVPFLLLASFCFSKSSKRFHNWFTSTKIYKNHLEDFEKNKSMTLSTKIKLLIISTTCLIFPLFFTKFFWLKIFIIFLMIFKYYFFIFRIKTKEI